MGYRDREFIAEDPERWPQIGPGGGMLNPTLVRDGRALGTLAAADRRPPSTSRLEPFEPLDARRRGATRDAEIADVARFEGLRGGVRQCKAPLLRRDARVRLDLVRDDHQEVLRGRGGEAEHALGLLVLAGRAQLVGVVAEEVLDVELALGVEVRQLDLGALAEAALDRVAVEVPVRVQARRRRGRRSCPSTPRGRCRRARRRGPRSCTRTRSPWRWRGRRAGRASRRAARRARRRARRRRPRGGCRSASRPSPERTGGLAGLRRRTTCRPTR